MASNRQVFHLFPALELSYAMSRAWKVGNTIYLSGFTAFDDSGVIVGVGDMAAQFRQIFSNVAKTLEHFNLGLDSIVEQSVYTTDISRVGEGVEVVKELWGDNEYPAAVCVEVKALADPDMLVEIKLTACE